MQGDFPTGKQALGLQRHGAKTRRDEFQAELDCRLMPLLFIASPNQGSLIVSHQRKRNGVWDMPFSEFFRRANVKKGNALSVKTTQPFDIKTISFTHSLALPLLFHVLLETIGRTSHSSALFEAARRVGLQKLA